MDNGLDASDVGFLGPDGKTPKGAKDEFGRARSHAVVKTERNIDGLASSRNDDSQRRFGEG